jgi:hypothetical protein
MKTTPKCMTKVPSCSSHKLCEMIRKKAQILEGVGGYRLGGAER